MKLEFIILVVVTLIIYLQYCRKPIEIQKITTGHTNSEYSNSNYEKLGSPPLQFLFRNP